MPFISNTDKGYLELILESLNKILTFTAHIKDSNGFYEDQRTFDAVLMNFVVIGEAVGKPEEQTLVTLNDIPWKQIKGFRNIIAHDYMGVDPEEVWEIININVRALQAKLSKEL